MSSPVQLKNNSGGALPKHLSPMMVWALSFGCAVGWGSFVMPGTTFLPIAGPLGSLLGLLIGAVVMFIIGMNYHYLMNRFPYAGGAYTYVSRLLGNDHGFLCAWLLLLTYAAILWANASALALFMRYLFGDFLTFGFSYTIAGYTVHLGELLLPITALVAVFVCCVFGKRLIGIVQTVLAVVLFGGILFCFVSVVTHNGGLAGMEQPFSANGSAATQIISIVILTPWAFIGFESVSHSTEEFHFSKKKTLPIIGVALITSALAYILLVLCASSALPEGFSDSQEYIASIGSLDGIKSLPSFYAVQSALGSTGVVVLGLAALCGIVSGIIATFVALSRLIYAMAEDKMLPKWFGKLGKRQTPVNALLFIMAVSCVVSFLGSFDSTAINWIVDVTTIGATVVYAYTSVSAFVLGRREKKNRYMVTGIIGFVISLVFIVFFMLPGVLMQSRLATESYIILAVWSIIGILVFCLLMQRDKTREIGKSEIVWLGLFFLILVVSAVWMLDSTSLSTVRLSEELSGYAANGNAETINSVLSEKTEAFSSSVTVYVIVLIVIIALTFLFIQNIFTVIRKREQQAEREKTRAEEISSAKSVFLSNVSHDLRTPMNAITGYTALALREEGLSPEIKNYLEKIDESSKRLVALINDVLDMSRIESGKIELEPMPEDITKIMDEMYDIFIMQMKAKEINYTVDASMVTDRYVVLDKERLDRVLLNLLSNALKFTPKGGAISATVIQTGRSNAEAYYRFCVRDNGIGMSPEFAEHVFENFEREKGKTRGIQGTGLGMSIAKSLVDLMNGTITLETENGKGTAFYIDISFPLASFDDIDETAEEIQELEGVDFSGKTVLLVEDNAINKEIAVMILEQEGFVVDYAENGQIAVEMAEAADDDKYDLILMDIQMPVMNGYEATKAIRKLGGRLAEVPIVAMSANAFADDVRDALEAGMTDHIAKPIDINVMMKTLDNVLNKR